MRLAAATALLLALAPAAKADDVFQQLREAEEQAGEAEARQAALAREIERLAADVMALKADLVASAAEIRQLEQDRMELDRSVLELGRQEQEKAAALASRREESTALLAGLVRVAQLPPEAVLGVQRSPLEVLRSGIALRSIVPAVQQRAVALRADIAELASLRQELDERRSNIARLEREMEGRQAYLAELVDRRAAQQAQSHKERELEARRLSEFAAKSQNLREMLSRLERENALTRELPPPPPPDPPPQTVFAMVMAESDAAVGTLWPVSGAVKEAFGQSDGQGGISRGVTISAPASAVVTSPFAGSVRFAGPFLNYKHILILEHPGGYHSLIAGLARIDVALGDAILAGEPVGAMGDPEAGGSDLYFELRQNGEPINPQQALAPGAVKGSG